MQCDGIPQNEGKPPLLFTSLPCLCSLKMHDMELRHWPSQEELAFFETFKDWSIITAE